MMTDSKKVNIQYSALQGSYWMICGSVFSFATLFLQGRGYSNYEIGIVLALGNIVSFAVQPLVAWIIDRSRQKALIPSILITSAVMAACILVTLLVSEHSILLAAAYMLILTGVMLLQPLCTSLCFHVNSWGYNINFGRSRAVGSFCYSLCMVIVGYLISKFGIIGAPASNALIILCFILISLVFFIREKKQTAAEAAKAQSSPKADDSDGVLRFLSQHKRFSVFLLGSAALFFTHCLISNFMIEFLRGAGGTDADLGNVLAFTALAEVPAMLFFSKLLKRFRCSTLLKFSVVMLTVKSIALWLAPSVPMVYVACLVQTVAYALYIPASVRYIDEIIEKRNAVKGQAFATSVVALGSIFSSYLGGVLLDISTASNTLLVGVLVSAVGTILCLPAIKKTDNSHEKA